jgi:hypothetical protein
MNNPPEHSEDRTIRIAQSCAKDPREAVREFHAGVASQQPALVTFFCSSEYDLDTIAEEMRRLFAGIPVIGCTTAGEIGPAGYRDHSLAGASFQAGSFHAVAAILTGLQRFDAARAYALAQALLQRLEVSASGARPENSFAFLMIDGLSVREEEVAHVLQDALGKLPLIGGSAGDGMKFAKTQVYFDGRFHTDAAVLTLFSTPLPFKAFMTEHFTVTDERVVVTEADAAHRVVREINGRPAIQEYARLIGVDPARVGSEHFAASPVVVRIGDTDYVRSIQKANADSSLTFYCAIETGMVLRLGRSGNLEGNVAHTFEQLRETLGPLQGVIACDCIFRNLEMTRCGVKQQVSEIFRNNRAVGFSTYGEQYLGVHINQTLTGIAIGAPGRPRHDGR